MKYSKDKIMLHLYDIKHGKCKKLIHGWWKDSSFEIYEALDSLQKERKTEGNLCEIGTRFGRSFLPLRNFTEDHETCIGIDIVTPTELFDNIKKCFGSLAGCKIIRVNKNSSASDKQKELEEYSPIRIFYIDGDHSYSGALLDLNVAKSTLHEDGIVFLDDYENPRHGPQIVRAVNKFLEENKEFALAFSSTQRIFLCRSHMVESYVSALSKLNWNVNKDVSWTTLINFEHPDGYNEWQTKQLVKG